ncbi:MAG: BrxE family protein [Pseudomonadota bacterium]
MKKEILKQIAALRFCIGFLGENRQHSWWDSSFLSATSKAFLSPIFNNKCLSAQYYGVKEAATLVHDEHIGIGKGVFHLFRLPEIHEIEMHRFLDDPDTKTDLQEIIKNKDAAEQFLSEFGEEAGEQAAGPYLMDDTSKILTHKSWKKVAAQYASAFKNNYKTFPYFTTA